MRVSLVMVTVVADSEGWVGTAYVYSIKLAITPLPNMQIVALVVMTLQGGPMIVPLGGEIVIDGSIAIIFDAKQYVVLPFHEPSPTYVALLSNSLVI
jgi:hypothetical protein